jgi:hypothetical protein
MSLKGPLRRLEAGVRWLETEGRLARVQSGMKILAMTQEIADRAAVDPAFAAKWQKDFAYVPLPPPRVGAPPVATPPLPARPAPVVVPDVPPPKVAPPAPAPVATRAAEREPEPEPAPLAEPVHLPGMPVSPFPDDMMVRPVQWRLRGPEDFYDDGKRSDGTHGRCLTDYDPLRDEYDD